MEGGLILLVILVLGAPFAVIALFVSTASLRARVERLESDLAALNASLAGARWGASVERAPVEAPAAAAFAAPPPPLEAEIVAPPFPEPPPEARRWIEQEPAWEEEPEEEAHETESFGALFERFVAGRLLVWTGAVALIGAGFFLIRYSIEIGLLTPQARMIGAAVFGFALVLVGEYSPRIRWLSDDPRVRQALVGAGIVILYATPYGSHALYDLIDSRTAALIMALVSVGALVLSLRHGAATALIGLLGGFLTPALVGDPSSSAVPLLVYLTLLNGAVFGIAWRRGWTWLAAGSVLLSFLWAGWLLDRPPGDAVAVGFFVVALSLAAALVRPGRGPQLAMMQPLAIGLAELAFLVGRDDLGFAAWAMFGALSAASVALALLRHEHRFAPAAALGLTLICITARAPDQDPFVPWAAAAATLLFAASAIPLAARGERLLRTVIACAALAGPALIVRGAWPELVARPAWGALLLALGAAALLTAWLQRREAGKDVAADIPILIAAATAALLLAVAALDLLPLRFVPAGWLAAALAIALAGRRIPDAAVTTVALILAAAASVRAAGMVSGLWETALGSLFGQPALLSWLSPPGDALVILALPAALLAGLAFLLREPPPKARRALLGAAAGFALAALYVFAKQLFAMESREEFALEGFAERTAINQALFLIGWLLSSGRLRLGRLSVDGAALGGAITLVAALRLIWFDMLVHNPLLDRQWVGTMPLLNLLLPAYFLSAAWLYEARRRSDAESRSGFWFGAFLAALVLGVALTVRQAFQGAYLDDLSSAPRAEVYMYSLAGLLLSAALIVGGMLLKDKAVRLAGLGLLTITILKVFLSDAAALEGLLRILSFFGLGVGLIGVALLYGPVLRAEAGARDQP